MDFCKLDDSGDDENYIFTFLYQSLICERNWLIGFRICCIATNVWHWAPHNTESHTQEKTNILNWKVTRNTAITRETIIPTTDISYVSILITYTVVGVCRCIEVMYSNIIYKTNVTPVSI